MCVVFCFFCLSMKLVDDTRKQKWIINDCHEWEIISIQWACSMWIIIETIMKAGKMDEKKMERSAIFSPVSRPMLSRAVFYVSFRIYGDCIHQLVSNWIHTHTHIVQRQSQWMYASMSTVNTVLLRVYILHFLLAYATNKYVRECLQFLSLWKMNHIFREWRVCVCVFLLLLFFLHFFLCVFSYSWHLSLLLAVLFDFSLLYAPDLAPLSQLFSYVFNRVSSRHVCSYRIFCGP